MSITEVNFNIDGAQGFALTSPDAQRVITDLDKEFLDAQITFQAEVDCNLITPDMGFLITYND